MMQNRHAKDFFRKTAGNAAQNFSMLSKIALDLLKQDRQTRQELKGNRLIAAYENSYILKILGKKVCGYP